jgi:hypothetical protein
MAAQPLGLNHVRARQHQALQANTPEEPMPYFPAENAAQKEMVDGFCFLRAERAEAAALHVVPLKAIGGHNRKCKGRT